MKFKIGDRVKFLNEKGGGVVSKILSNTMVNVTIDEGFDIPVMAGDLILIESNSAGQRLFNEQYNVGADKGFEDILSEENTASRLIAKKPFAIPEAIYLAVVPLDQKRLIIADVEVYLINNTAYDVIYTMFVRDRDKYLGIDFGNIESYSTVSLQIADRDQLEYFGHGMMQLLFFTESVTEMIPPVQKEYRVKISKLMKEDNYPESPIFKSKAYIQKVADLPEAAVEKNSEAVKEIPKIPESQLVRESMILKHRVDEDFAEVDLHIEALCEDPNKLRGHEKMQIQLDYFTRCLESAIMENFKRVVFIHGVGVGILKLELVKILNQYEFLEFFDASIARYGIGATEVVIHGKRE